MVWTQACFLHLLQEDWVFSFPYLQPRGVFTLLGGGGRSGLRFFSGGDKGPGRALYFPVVTVTSLLQASSAVQVFPFFNLVGTLDCASGQVPLFSLVAEMLRAKYFVCTQWM